MISIIIVLILLLLGVNSFEINTLFKEELKRTEHDYTECLNRSSLMDSQSSSLTNMTHLVSIGTILRLECNNLCLGIKESVDNLWVYMSAKKVRLDVRSENTNLLKDLSLEVTFDNQNDSATYYCIYNSSIYAIHQITVTDSEPFHLNLTKTQSNEINVKNLKAHGLQLFTQWSVWTDCNRCPIGLKRKVGICKIRYKDDNTFNDSGIPCRSIFLPKQITSIDEIQKEKSQILFSFCRKQCHNETQFHISKEEVIKKLTKITQLIRSSEMKVGFVGEKVVISCNKVFNAKNHYVWRNYSINFKNIRFHYINPMKVHIRTKGRVQIDFRNNLVINYALESDQRLYKCFDSVNNETISVTKLRVKSAVKEITFWSAIKQHFSAFLIIVTIISFGFTLWKNRKLETKI